MYVVQSCAMGIALDYFLSHVSCNSIVHYEEDMV